MTSEQVSKLIPVKGIPACPAVEPLLPGFPNSTKELPNTTVVRGSPVILIVAAQLAVENFLLFLHRIMPMLPTPGRNLREATSKSFPHRPQVNGEFPIPASFA